LTPHKTGHYSIEGSGPAARTERGTSLGGSRSRPYLHPLPSPSLFWLTPVTPVFAVRLHPTRPD